MDREWNTVDTSDTGDARAGEGWRRRRLAVMLLLAGYLLSGCGGGQRLPSQWGCPVFLISIDTLRPDHLGCYGYSRLATPGVDRLAADGIRFVNASAQAPSTLPSHASMLTSLYPDHHGAFYGHRTRIAPSVTTLAAVLSGAGYRTLSYNGGGQIAPEFGLDHGFDRYVVLKTHRFSANVDSALSWIELHGADSTFFFLHTYEVHAPFTPPARLLNKLDGDYGGPLPGRIGKELLLDINKGRIPLTDDDARHITAAYDGEILSMDSALDAFFDSLHALGIYDAALIIFTSDHGEEFGERGSYGVHGHTMYDELLRVPLIIKLPGSLMAGRVDSLHVRSLDIAPTILDLLGTRAPPSFEGASVVPLLLRQTGRERRKHARVSIAQKDMGRSGFLKSIRTEDWKLIVSERRGRSVRTELYHLLSDPDEKADVAGEHPETVASLSRTMAVISQARPIPDASRAVISRQTNRRLEALGYVVDE